jgi:hypothetical protein
MRRSVVLTPQGALRRLHLVHPRCKPMGRKRGTRQSARREPREKAEGSRRDTAIHWASKLGCNMNIPRPPPGVPTDTAFRSSGTMYVDPPPVCRTAAPANSAAIPPSDISLMLGIVAGDSALARKITVPPFEQKSPRSVFVLSSRPVASSTDAIARGGVLSLTRSATPTACT